MSFGKQVVERSRASRWQLAIAYQPAGAAIRVLGWLSLENVDAELDTLKRTLSLADFRELVMAAPQLPTWLARSLGKPHMTDAGRSKTWDAVDRWRR